MAQGIQIHYIYGNHTKGSSPKDSCQLLYDPTNTNIHIPIIKQSNKKSPKRASLIYVTGLYWKTVLRLHQELHIFLHEQAHPSIQGALQPTACKPELAELHCNCSTFSNSLLLVYSSTSLSFMSSHRKLFYVPSFFLPQQRADQGFSLN